MCFFLFFWSTKKTWVPLDTGVDSDILISKEIGEEQIGAKVSRLGKKSSASVENITSLFGGHPLFAVSWRSAATQGS